MHIICYSGGIQSALVAIEVARKLGTDNMMLINHDISSRVEDRDIKQYKNDIANYLGLSVISCNSQQYTHLDPIQACIDIKAWKGRNTPELCTAKLKTEPFHQWLKENNIKNQQHCIYYGFDCAESNRIARRKTILGCDMGYNVDFPLLWKKRTINDTAAIGIPKPDHYKVWKHGNCIGCPKAGWQHWYCVFVNRPDCWKFAKQAEKIIGYSILRRNSKPCFLKERELEFTELHAAGLPATEHIPSYKFWSMARAIIKRKK